VPRVAPEWGAFLHRCRDARRSAFREVTAYKNMATEEFFDLIDIRTKHATFIH
jgi:hypothetical protein